MCSIADNSVPNILHIKLLSAEFKGHDSTLVHKQDSQQNDEKLYYNNNDDGDDYGDSLQTQPENYYRAKFQFLRMERNVKQHASFSSYSLVSLSVEQAVPAPRRSELTRDKEDLSHFPSGKSETEKK